MTITRDDKKKIREERRSLRYDLKVWTLKAPGSHPELNVICLEHRKPNPTCEPCSFVLFRRDKADQARAEIRTLTDRLEGRTPEPKPEPATRQAVVVTGSGEQLVMFV